MGPKNKNQSKATYISATLSSFQIIAIYLAFVLYDFTVSVFNSEDKCCSLHNLLPLDWLFRASDGSRTRTGIAAQGILSPSCLPIPPPKQLKILDQVLRGAILSFGCTYLAFSNLLLPYLGLDFLFVNKCVFDLCLTQHSMIRRTSCVYFTRINLFNKSWFSILLNFKSFPLNKEFISSCFHFILLFKC